MLDGHGTTVQGSIVDAPALHPFHCVAQLLQLSLLLLVLLHLQVKASLFFIHVEGIIAGIKLGMTIENFNHTLSNLIDEIPVVGDCQYSTLERLNILLQPFHAV